MSATPGTYTSLVTSEFQTSPNFLATVSALVQAFVDQQNLLAQFPALFTVTLAVGDQLDKIGAWVGVSRYLTQDIDGVSTLTDVEYRVLILLYIAANNWDGTVPGIYAIWNAILAPYLGPIIVVDNQDMTMGIYLLDIPSNLLLLGMLANGYFTLRPAGVGVNIYTPSIPDTPFFGFDTETDVISGFDVGAFAVLE